MNQDESFADLFETQTAAVGRRKRLRAGERVKGTIVAISDDTVFVDIGDRVEGHLARQEVLDANGELKVSVGDTIDATVVHAGRGAPELKVAFGRGASGVAELQLAAESGAPVEGSVSKAVKAGLEVDIGGKRAFCPASHVDLQFVKDLEPYVGNNYFFRILEVKDNGRSIVVSRRALLEAERAKQGEQLLEKLEVGAELDGIVQSLQAYGAFIELGGLQGLVHVSEISQARIAAPSDVLSVGESVRVRVKSIETQPDGKPPRVSLTMKDSAAVTTAPGAELEVVTATVDKVESYGVLVSTQAGAGLIPTSQLDLPPGTDPRRRYQVGSEVQVVQMRAGEQGKLRFSARAVADVEEKQAFATFRRTQRKSGTKSGGLGSLGDLLAGVDLGSVTGAKQSKGKNSKKRK